MLLDNLLPSILGAFAEPLCFYQRLKQPQMVSFGLFASLKKMRSKNIICQIDSIWDVGANEGQFAFMAKNVWPMLPIYSFEPDPSTFVILEKNFQKFSIKGKAFPYALGDRVEEKMLIQYQDSVNNSMLNHKSGQKIVGNTKVKCTTLDDIYNTLPEAKSAFLKLDVQGFELLVLAGSKRFLERCKFVLIEVSFSPSYRSGAHAGEIIMAMHQLGFECIEILDLLRDKNQLNKITEADLLFKKIVQNED